MNRIIYIVPYFGKLPEYFNEWIYTAGYLEQQNIDFLIITDCPYNGIIPHNVTIHNKTFQEFRELVQQKFEFKIALNSPYKICDFKPAFGYIFQEWIHEYDFWGNCDIDVIWGTIKSVITDEILSNYDRIQYMGHGTLYRNTKRMNELFMQPGALYSYKKVFSSNLNYAFDEHPGMMRIVKRNHVRNFYTSAYADLTIRYSRMHLSGKKNYSQQLLYWQDGHVYRVHINDNGDIEKDEYIYFHFQKKNPRTLECWSNGEVPSTICYNVNGFYELEKGISLREAISMHSDFISSERDEIENCRYCSEKKKEFLRLPLRRKILWLCQKLAAQSVKSLME